MANITGFSSTYFYEDFGGIGYNHDLWLGADIPFYPADAEYDFEVASTNSSIVEPFNSIPDDISAITVNNGVVHVNLRFYRAQTGSAVVTLTDRISNKNTARIIYNNVGSPNIYTNPSAVTLASDFSFHSHGYISDMLKISETQATGTNVLSGFPGGTGGIISNGWGEPSEAPGVFSYLSGDTWNVLLDGVDENTGQTREALYFGTAQDTDYNTFYAEFLLRQVGSGQPLTSWVWLSTSAGTVSSQNQAYSFTAYTSGCVMDTTNFSYTISGDSFITGITISNNHYENQYLVTCRFPRNTGVTNKEAYINFVFQDTSGNTYPATANLLQGSGVWLALNPNSIVCTSAATTSEVTIEEANCNFDHILLTGSSGDFASLVTTGITGNKITVSVPKNETNQPSRYCMLYYQLYDTSGNTYVSVLSVVQDAGGEPENIAVNITDVNVGSGSSSTSGTVSTTSCTYDHFTYMTGGSMQLTVTTGANNTIYVNAPANNTSNSRVGYVYITFYDTDGNQYYQTVTIRQAAGSGPGPGPQPEPTWNVLTSLTISDNEQHRFFIEAEPGKSYKANGIEYKTVSACQARYSLYYVNSYGGVDVLPFKGGGQKKTDNITRFNYSRSFRNNTLEYENVNYMNEIKPSWELKTGYMTDDQSKKMHELVESTIVYLYDAEEKEYTPVVMTDKKLEYKTFHNQGKKFYNYTVNVEESQSRERR